MITDNETESQTVTATVQTDPNLNHSSPITSPHKPHMFRGGLESILRSHNETSCESLQ